MNPIHGKNMKIFLGRILGINILLRTDSVLFYLEEKI